MLRLKDNEILVMRTCKADMTSRNGFKYPKKGVVIDPDWEDTDDCRNGLHGLPWGAGGNYLSQEQDAVWQIIRVCTESGNYRHGTGQLRDKCKFRKGFVVYSGTQVEAIMLLHKYAPAGTLISYDINIQGDWGTSTQGDCGVAIQGNYSKYAGKAGNVLVNRYYKDGEVRLTTHIVTAEESDKWLCFEDGVYTVKEK